MRVSEQGRALIRKHEGFRSDRYLCPAGKPTIGYGHCLRFDESFSTVTAAEADRLLAEDLARVESALAHLVRVPLSQGQFDALASFTYNLGPGALELSTLLRKLNAGDYDGAAEEFGKWCHVGKRVLPGLVARRADERALFEAA